MLYIFGGIIDDCLYVSMDVDVGLVPQVKVKVRVARGDYR